jgi:hypothetical protein
MSSMSQKFGEYPKPIPSLNAYLNPVENKKNIPFIKHPYPICKVMC